MSYTYDAVGNISTKTVGSDNYGYSYDDPYHKHAVSVVNLNGNDYSFFYDQIGNMEEGIDFTDLSELGTRIVSYNANNTCHDPQDDDHNNNFN